MWVWGRGEEWMKTLFSIPEIIHATRMTTTRPYIVYSYKRAVTIYIPFVWNRRDISWKKYKNLQHFCGYRVFKVSTFEWTQPCLSLCLIMCDDEEIWTLGIFNFFWATSTAAQSYDKTQYITIPTQFIWYDLVSQSSSQQIDGLRNKIVLSTATFFFLRAVSNIRVYQRVVKNFLLQCRTTIIVLYRRCTIQSI